jgi:Yip1-like protein
MSGVPPVAPTAGPRPVVARVRSILVEPRAEWAVIDAEPATIGSIYRYVLILAAIPAICRAIRWSMVGYFRLTPLGAAQFAITSYIGALIAVFALALIIDALAPTFGGQKGQIPALKVAAYSATAAWVSGIFLVIPLLGILALVGALYSLYLLYLGLPVLMKTPADRSASYTVVTVIAAIVVFTVIGAIVGRLSGIGPMFSGYGGYQ